MAQARYAHRPQSEANRLQSILVEDSDTDMDNVQRLPDNLMFDAGS